MPKNQRPWMLKLDGGFELRNQEGQIVRFPYRKVEELFVVMAHERNETVSRDAISEKLWPMADRKSRHVNLRQTLSQLRKILGDQWLQTSRSGCQLSAGFPLLIEADSLAPISAKEPSTVTPMNGFVTMIEWLAQNDPCQMLEMMRASIDFTSAIPPPILLRALEVAAPRLHHNYPLQPWLHFWRGFAILGFSNLHEAQSHFRLAAKGSELHQDSNLLLETYFWWGASEILLGRATEALKLVERAKNTLAQWRKSDRFYKIDNLRGTALLHLSRNDEALKIFESVTGYNSITTLDFAHHEALRALYLATLGHCRTARETLEFPMRRATESGLSSMMSVCQLTTGIIETTEDPRRAILTLTALAETAKHSQDCHIAIYTQEALAVAQLKVKNLEESERHLDRSLALRRRLGMIYTGWDIQRLKLVLAAKAS